MQVRACIQSNNVSNNHKVLTSYNKYSEKNVRATNEKGMFTNSNPQRKRAPQTGTGTWYLAAYLSRPARFMI